MSAQNATHAVETIDYFDSVNEYIQLVNECYFDSTGYILGNYYSYAIQKKDEERLQTVKDDIAKCYEL